MAEDSGREQLRVVYRGEWIYLGFRPEPFANPDSYYTRCPFCGHEERHSGLCLLVCRACGAELELKMPGRGN